MTGTFYGVGTGPGDPELLTMKAHRVLSDATVVAYPVNGDGQSMALSIAESSVNPDAAHIPVPVPMSTRREPAQTAYDSGAGIIAEHLDAGSDVAFLCEGDPFFYGSFMYLFARLCQRYDCRVVPGVTSLTACAAELGKPLAGRNDILKILPAPLDDDVLARELAGAQSAAIIKVGRHFPRIKALLERLELAPYAHIVESATLTAQNVTSLEDVSASRQPYFSTILIYCGSEDWA